MITREIFTRDFILCFAAQVAFASVSFILIPTLPIYLSRLGSAEIEIGILIGAFGISSLLLRPVVGKALSKSGEKKFMVVGAIVSALTSMAYLIAPPFWPFFIVRILQGIGSAFFFTATIILISNITPQTHRGESLGYFFLSFNISMVLAPPFGIFLINHFGFTTLFLVCVFLSLGALLISCRLRSSEVKPIVDSSIEDSSFFTPKAFPPIFVYFLAHIIWGALATFPSSCYQSWCDQPRPFLCGLCHGAYSWSGFGRKDIRYLSKRQSHFTLPHRLYPINDPPCLFHKSSDVYSCRHHPGNWACFSHARLGCLHH